MMNEFYARLQLSPPTFDRGRAHAAPKTLLSHLAELLKCDPPVQSRPRMLQAGDLRRHEQVAFSDERINKCTENNASSLEIPLYTCQSWPPFRIRREVDFNAQLEQGRRIG